MDDPQNGTYSSRHETRLLSLKDFDETLISTLHAQARLLLFEVPDDTSPRLFILLPSTQASNDDLAHAFLKPFQLHFFCECSLYKNQDEDDFTTLDATHLADHPGYCLQRPTELFTKLVPVMLASAQGARIGAQAASLIVPAAQLATDQVVILDKQLRAKKGRCDIYTNKDLKVLLDEAIEFLASMSQHDNDEDSQIAGSHSAVKDPIEVKVVKMEQRGKLIALLGKEDRQSLGNLHRTVNGDRPRWLCRAHFWKFDPKEAKRQFLRFVINNGGSFEEAQGKLTIKLDSPVEAREFYDDLIHDGRVRELDVYFRWVTARSDIQELTTALMKSRTIVSLHLGGRSHAPDSSLAAVARTTSIAIEVAASIISAVPNIMNEIIGQGHVYALAAEFLTVDQIYAPLLLELLAEGPIETIEIHSAEFLDCLGHLSVIPWFPSLETLGIHGIRTDKRKRLFLQFLKRCTSLQTLHLSDVRLVVPSLEVCSDLRVLILDRGILSSTEDLKAVLDQAVALLKARKATIQKVRDTTLQILIRSSLMICEKDQVSIVLSDGGITIFSNNLRDDESLKSVIEGYGWASGVAS